MRSAEIQKDRINPDGIACMNSHDSETVSPVRDHETLPGVPVALVSCADYEASHVYDAMRRAITLIGGLERWVSPGTRVLVKPNLLQGLPPESAVCTHPAVLGAVIRLMNEHGCTVTLADSPGGGIRYTAKNLMKQYREAGYLSLAENPGCTLNQDVGFRQLIFHEGKVCREFPIINPCFSSDHIVVVSKAKAHILTLMTGATKNLFGLIPGLEKPLLHSRFQTAERFGDMIIDLNLAVNPSLQVADAILAMEGDGPTSGNPRHIGVLLVSPSPLALDIVLCRLMSIDPLDVPYLSCAIQRGLCTAEGKEITLLGDPPDEYAIRAFKKPRTYLGSRRNIRPSPLFRMVHKMGRVYGVRPTADTSRCTGCGKCAAICPAGAITMSGGHARIHIVECIRCFCCHEMCTEGAISLKRSVPGSILHLALRGF